LNRFFHVNNEAKRSRDTDEGRCYAQAIRRRAPPVAAANTSVHARRSLPGLRAFLPSLSRGAPPR